MKKLVNDFTTSTSAAPKARQAKKRGVPPDSGAEAASGSAPSKKPKKEKENKDKEKASAPKRKRN